jgi:hypothetical protein
VEYIHKDLILQRVETNRYIFNYPPNFEYISLRAATTFNQPLVTTDSIGLVEESNEANNMGVMTVFVKAPDTTFLQFLTLFCAFVGETTWFNWTLPDLTLSLESLLAGSGTTLTTIATGAVGAVVLLIVTVPPTADEWPDAVPGMMQGDEVLIVVEGSYGQGHIEQRAQSDDKCIRYLRYI